MRNFCLGFFCLFFITSSVVGEETVCINKEECFETEHTITIDGKPLTYTAVVGSLLLKDKECQPKVNFFFTSYTKKEAKGPRPVTFCFNGGPGSSSVWLHMGLAGPKRIQFSENGMPALPNQMTDNTCSFLAFTDLVFIDPISTGYSRAIPRAEEKSFYGLEEDIKIVADFIELYLTKYNRWASPKFIMGESYGTTRATALTEHLREEHFIDINGVLLISSILNFQTCSFRKGNDLPYTLFLPSYTAAAWYHKKLSPEMQKNLLISLEKAREFAVNEYSVALLKGDLLSQEEKRSIAEKLSTFTGLSPSYIEMSNLRVNIFCFAKELLRDQRKTIGRFDSRILGVDTSPLQATIEYDPSLDDFTGVFTATFNNYLLNDLKCSLHIPYKILTNVFPWDYACDNKYYNASQDLVSSLTKNRSLRVFVANGDYDLATPFFATEYTMHHLDLDPSIQSHVTMKSYEGGHMMYTIPKVLHELKEDVSSFYEETLKAAGL